MCERDPPRPERGTARPSAATRPGEKPRAGISAPCLSGRSRLVPGGAKVPSEPHHGDDQRQRSARLSRGHKRPSDRKTEGSGFPFPAGRWWFGQEARRRGAGDSDRRQPRAAGRAAGRRSERRAVPGLRPTRRRKRKAAGPEIRPGAAPGQRVPDPLARRPAPHLQRAAADTLSGRLAAAPPPGPRLPGRPAAPARAPARSSHRRAAPPRAAEETRRSRAPPAAAIAGGRVTTGCDAGGAAAAARGSPRAGGRGPRRGRAGGCRSGPARAARRPPRRRGDL